LNLALYMKTNAAIDSSATKEVPLDDGAGLLLNSDVKATWGKQLDLLHDVDDATGGLQVRRFHSLLIVKRPAKTSGGEHQLWRRSESNGRRNQRPGADRQSLQPPPPLLAA